ncbi:putative siderophore transport system permease protein YfiZ precursor [compost metagenome]
MGSTANKWIGLILGVLLLAASMLISIRFGFTVIGWNDIKAALWNYDEASMEQVVVRTARLPRTLIAASIGASLAVAGAIMQAVTRNPLASPSVLGINAGASFAIVLAITFLGISDINILLWMSLAGSGITAVIVYILGSIGREGLSPLRIILAGCALIALFSSGTQGLLVLNQSGLQDVIFWLTGSIASRDLDTLIPVFPYLCFGWIAAFLLAGQLNILVLGENTAKNLGQKVVYIQLAAGVVVVLLAGGSVAIAGPIGLVGIIVPYLSKYLAGRDHRWLLPYCAIIGAILLLLADVAARLIILPEEVPVGIMTAAIGAPFFIYLARKELRRE